MNDVKTSNKGALVFKALFDLLRGNVGRIMSGLTKDDKFDPMQMPPMHPGVVMRRFLLPNLKLRKEEVSEKSSIPENQMADLLEGKQDITEELRDKLRLSLGDVADGLFGLQELFDYYARNGVRPPLGWEKPAPRP